MTLKKLASYFDFMTIRGLFVLGFAIFFILSGIGSRERISSLVLGVFLLTLFLIDLTICFLIKSILRLNQKNIEFHLDKETYFAGERVKITRLNLTSIPKLANFFPIKAEISAPARLGGNLIFELNKDFFNNGQIFFAKAKRGKYEIGPTYFTINDFFGLVKVKFIYNETRTIQILPYFENLQNISYKFLDRSYREHKQVRRLISNESLFDIKEYDPGDDMRKISWKLSARMDDKLLVKKPENININIQNSITMFLDNSYPGISTEAVHSAFDKQVSIAATLGTFYLKHGAKVKLCYLDKYNSLKIYKQKDFNSFLKFLCLIDFNNKSSKKPTKSRKFNQPLDFQQDQSIDPITQSLNLREDNLIYIYNSLTSPYRYNVSSDQAKNVVKNICVDVKTFIDLQQVSKESWLSRIFFTKEYFSLRAHSQNETKNQQWTDYISSKKVPVNQNIFIVKATDPLNKILNV